MAGELTIRIDDREVSEALSRVVGATRMGILELAARAGALPIQNQAKVNVHKRTGNLARSIHHEVTKRSPNSVTVSVGTNAIYAKMEEYGGIIVPRNKKFLAWQSPSGEWIFAKRVVRRGHPFMRPAFDSKSAEARAIAFKVILAKAGLA